MILPVQWLSDKIDWTHSNDPDFRYKIVDFYTKFKFKNIVAEVGDFVLISNADACDPDTVEGCDIGQIVKLYQSHDKVLKDKFRAHVQWFCKFDDIPDSCLDGVNFIFNRNEVVEDHRPYDKDVSIETFFKKCQVLKYPTTAVIDDNKVSEPKIPTFSCRFKLVPTTKKKCTLKPILDDEMDVFCLGDVVNTPQKKRERKKTKDDWFVKKIEKSKLILMRDITNNIKRSPPLTPSKTPNKSRKSTIGTLSPHKDKIKNLEKTPTRKSSRPVRQSLKYAEDDSENLLSKQDDFKMDISDDSDDDFLAKKVKKKITSKVKKSALKHEPVPNISDRKIPIQVEEGALQKARESLHVSSVPLNLPCREEEFNNIYSFIENKIADNVGGCMYISGVPGTGKTATITEVVRCLRKQEKVGNLPKFDYVEVNGMRLTEPRQAYVHIYRQLTGKTVAWEQACSLLETRFTKPAPRRCTTVLLIDELDVLCNRRQDVLYNLFDWPSKSVAHLVVIAIANTMDLPERLLMGRVASRVGLTRLTFQPYTYSQLQNIVMARLADTGAFNPDAVQLVARKVAAVSGDARRALDICRRAVELVQLNENPNTQVSLTHVNRALDEMITSPKVQAIKSCSKLEKIFLQSVSSEVQRTGIEETTFRLVYQQMESICAFVGLKAPTATEALRICCRLGSTRLIINDNPLNDINQKILLNVSADDIHYATQKIFS